MGAIADRIVWGGDEGEATRERRRGGKDKRGETREEGGGRGETRYEKAILRKLAPKDDLGEVSIRLLIRRRNPNFSPDTASQQANAT